MFNSKRVWTEPVHVDTAAELAEKLTQHDWTLCTAFEHGGVLYLNDSLSENGAAEYAVVVAMRDSYPGAAEGNYWAGSQFESVTFGWMSDRQEDAQRLIEGYSEKSKRLALLASFGKAVVFRTHGHGDYCQLCA